MPVKVTHNSGPVGVVGDMTAACERVYVQFELMFDALEYSLGPLGPILAERRCEFIREVMEEGAKVLAQDDSPANPFRAFRVTHAPPSNRKK
jgi:hypothetical protein